MKKHDWLFWLPRLFTVIAIGLVFATSFDSFGTGNGFWNDMQGFLIHNIPTAVLILIFILTWKWEIVGAILFPLAGIAWITFLSIRNIEMLISGIIVAAPFIVVGILFYFDWKRQTV
ncbi:MAG TPA: hypothetical protein PLH02_04630 [Bacillota bacterium]|nr:hypothetical protein [Bacillota bacterium]HPF42494.1 hypothetical protein [Bacillota bacterium]HPJ85853.1 hypothetical protein [Bacillota bacterium]HPQ62135.1 hypothetical protein [Bacillota bacterium]HRX91675.1 hypothetical protein [Candidatus Izemoplasmatales bacterium]